MSHELRTPLAAITGASSALIETGGTLSAQTKAEMLETVYVEADRMERRINNLLDMTRMESGGLALKREWHPFQQIVSSTLQHLDKRLRGRQVTTDVAPDLPLVQIDAVAIEQVLTNLIDNAVEYTPPDGAIDVYVRATDGQLTVDVADHGPGLPPGTENRVFEKFFRVRPTESRRGIGLGLAIARGIVEAHGGRMSATNRPGGGALFRLTLPLTGTPPTVDGSG